MKLAEVAVLQQERNGLTAAAGPPLVPQRAWFERDEPEEPVGWTVTSDGQVFGHAALWGTCHTGKPGRCITPPKSRSQYAYYQTGLTEVDDGELIPTGRITLGTGHANLTASPAATAEHYDNTGSVVADVTVKDGKHGVWVTGALRPDVTPERIRELRGASLSGDWRSIRGALEMLGLLAVNVPGFPVPRAMTASGENDEVLALVAAGMLREDEVMEVADMSDEQFDEELDALYASSKKSSDRYMKKQHKIAAVMREFKAGKLKTKDGKKVTNRKQALAVAFSSSGHVTTEEIATAGSAGFTFSHPTDPAEAQANAYATSGTSTNSNAGTWNRDHMASALQRAAAGEDVAVVAADARIPEEEFGYAALERAREGETVDVLLGECEQHYKGLTAATFDESDFFAHPSYTEAVGTLVGRYVEEYANARNAGAEQATALTAASDTLVADLDLQEFFAEDELGELFPDMDPDEQLPLDELAEKLAEDAERRAKKGIDPDYMKASADPNDLPAAKGAPAERVDGAVPAASLTASMRAACVERGEAMPDGTYVIRNRAELQAAITASAELEAGAEVCGWIATRAEELGAVGDLPATWDLEVLQAAVTWSERDHPRWQKGRENGGQFSPKGEAESGKKEPAAKGASPEERLAQARESRYWRPEYDAEPEASIAKMADEVEKEATSEALGEVMRLLSLDKKAAETVHSELQRRKRLAEVRSGRLEYTNFAAGGMSDREVLTAIGFFDESKHPRHPKGVREGGRFAPKYQVVRRGEILEEHDSPLEAENAAEFYEGAKVVEVPGESAAQRQRSEDVATRRESFDLGQRREQDRVRRMTDAQLMRAINESLQEKTSRTWRAALRDEAARRKKAVTG